MQTHRCCHHYCLIICGNLKPNVVSTELKREATTIETANDYLSSATAMVIMDLYQSGALMRFNASVSYKELSLKEDTFMYTGASLSFVSKEFVMANGFYKDCKIVLKLSIQVAS